MDTLHLITIHESAATDILASGAKISVRIAGQSFFTGNEAFKKAAEVVAFVAALNECSISAEKIHLNNVVLEVESGLLTKSSSATYHLLVECDSIELLGKVLTAIASQKNAETQQITWEYTDLEKTRRDLTQATVRAAKQSAQDVANALAVSLQGVHKLSFHTEGLNQDLSVPMGTSSYVGRSRKSKAPVTTLEGLHLSHSTTVKVTVTAEFMIGTFLENAD
ncbi:MAG: hypothetical protein COA78_22705 [Blastopirellula sp.]|nr:MAG: hypothetical protein COA78_22705 [Blastopirellula sp.]